MTSDSTVSALPSAQCETCPGPAACRLLRMDARSAYVAGCRAPIARDANTTYTRERRAQRRAQGHTGAVSEWDSPEDERSPEPTGEPCPECGEPLAALPTQAGEVCASGHFRLPAEASERAADSLRARKREPGADVESRPSVIDAARLDAERARIIRLCESSLAELDTSQLAEISASVPWYYYRPGWNEEIAHTLIAVFRSFIRQAGAARNADELREIDNARQTVTISPEMSNTRAMIQQEFRDTANGLTYRSQGTARYRVEPENPNRIQALPAGNPAGNGATPESIAAQQWRAQPGGTRHFPNTITPLPNTFSALKAIGRAYHDPEDEDYEDEDYEDEDYEEYPRRESSGRRVIYDDNESHGNALLWIVGAIVVIGAGMYLYSEINARWNRAGYLTCENPEHSGRPALAREHFRGVSAMVNVCHRPECRTWGHSATLYRQGYGEPIEPNSGPIPDAAGNVGYEITARGKYRKNKAFTGALIQ